MFATYNGENTLKLVLDAYCRITLPQDQWKLIIVDNGSNDKTRSILKSYTNKLPLQIVSEPKRGKNIALNRGLASIEGDLVVFTDDDVLPQPDWLLNLRRSAETQDAYSIFAGTILPKWTSPPDEWIIDWVPLRATFAILDDIEDDGPIENHSVFGPNMAIRSKIFLSGYRFDESIGPKGKRYAMGSESELLLRLEKDGYKAWYCKNAVVQHIIRPSQMTQDWILSRAIRMGRGQYRLNYDSFKSRYSVHGISPGLLLDVIKRFWDAGKAKLFGDEKAFFKERWRLNYRFGCAMEALMMHKEFLRK